jgi:hypothetical protein
MTETYKKFKNFLWRPRFIPGASFSVALSGRAGKS